MQANERIEQEKRDATEKHEQLQIWLNELEIELKELEF